MMKKGHISILHLITTLDVGGAEKMLFRLLSSMNKGEFSNQVVSITDIGLVGREMMEKGTRVYSLNMPRGRCSPIGLIKLWWLLRAVRPTILQTWLYHADLLGLVFGSIGRIETICWNVRCSYMDVKKYRFSTKWTIRLCALLSYFPKAIITNSEAARQFHTNLGYRVKRWEVIPNGFDLNEFSPDKLAKERLLAELGLADHEETKGREDGGVKKTHNSILLIGFIARYDPMKDHRTFIKAACFLLEDRKGVHFVLAGRDVTWENSPLARQIPDSCKGRFHFLAQRDDVEKITAGLDIASSISYGEGFPNTIGEAMSCGVPCVVTDVGDSARIVGDTGRVVPPKDPYALARAWKELIDLGGEGRLKLGLAARKRITDHFELSQIARRYENFYSSLVMGKMIEQQYPSDRS